MAQKLTEEVARKLGVGDCVFTLHSARIAGKVISKSKKWRVGSRVRVWKKDPARFEIGIKNGLYTHAYITQDNVHEFYVTDPLEGERTVIRNESVSS